MRAFSSSFSRSIHRMRERTISIVDRITCVDHHLKYLLNVIQRYIEPFKVSVAVRKGAKMAPGWPLCFHLIFPSQLRRLFENGPERSRARRCWARRSEPLTARTVPRE